jgi:3-hydroxyisobutyrate dehydrogenase-like beta-hydroxyacid dehydrogenase
MGGEIRHLGAPGTASLAKLAINNLIYGINQAAAEALVLAERGGLDRELIYDAFLGSAAAAPMLAYRREAFLHPREGEVAFTLALAEKDLRLTLELAARLGVPMPQAALNRDVARAAMAAGYGEDEMSIVAEHLRHADGRVP